MSDSGIFNLTGRVAWVTGAAGLLGREHCRALAAAGANVVAVDLNGPECRKLAESLPTECLSLEADITQPDSIRAALEVTMKKFDRVDVLVNNAAINDLVDYRSGVEKNRFEDFPLASWNKILEVNITGTFLCSQIVGSVMAGRGSGCIINISSTYGLVAPDQSLYCNAEGSQVTLKDPAYPTTKGAVLSFTRFLAAYWGGRGVRVNSLTPGGVDNQFSEPFVRSYSRRTPLGRMASTRDYRGAIVFLASEASAYMTGANLVVDGGWTAW